MTTPAAPAPADVAAIAKKLTEKQREALLSALKERTGLYRIYSRSVIRKALRTRGLGHVDWCYLTPLGLAVRAHLQEQSHD